MLSAGPVKCWLLAIGLATVGHALQVPFEGHSSWYVQPQPTLPTFASPGAAYPEVPLAVLSGSMRVDGQTNPLGIGNTSPVISWLLGSNQRGVTQYAYQVIAATSSHHLRNAHPNLIWDSGKVVSDETSVQWGGPALTSRTKVYFTVRVWETESSKPTSYSDYGFFEMALLEKSDWSAQWITNPDYVNPTGLWTTNISLPYYAKDFDIPCKVDSARLYMSGLGQHRAYINGKDISTSNLLAPGYTVFNVTVEYASYDVSDLLLHGANTIGTVLGKGGYDFELFAPASSFSYPPGGGLADRYTMYGGVGYVQALLIAQLEYTCRGTSDLNTIASGTDWVTSLSGPLLESAWLGGEAYNASREMPGWNAPSYTRSASDWTNATIWSTGGPADADLIPQIRPDLSITEEIAPIDVFLRDNDWIIDFGVNLVGWYTLRFKGDAGQEVQVYPQDYQMIDGNISTFLPMARTFDSYYFKTANNFEQYSPQTTYYGFRWLRVKNLGYKPDLADAMAYRIHTAADPIGTFTTDNDLINRISSAIRGAGKGNFYSTLTDCPHREKTAWLEDQHLAYDVYGNYFDMRAIGRNIGKAVRDEQSLRPDDEVPTTAPRYMDQEGTHDNDPNWGSNVVNFQWSLYQDYKSPAILQEGYDAAKKYIAYMQSQADAAGTIDFGMGDWAAADTSTPVRIVATYGLWRSLDAMVSWATLLGETEDAANFRAARAMVVAGLNSETFNSSNGTYGSGSIASIAIGLATGAAAALDGGNGTALVDQQRALLNALDLSGNHTTSGEVGLRAMIDALMTFEAGKGYLWALATATTYPSHGYVVNQPNITTMTELWNGSNFDVDNLVPGSQNHFMLGGIERWFARGLAGVDHADMDAGWKNVTVEPHLPPSGLTSVSRTFRTTRGYFIVEWDFDESSGIMVLNLGVPVGTVARVRLQGPGASMAESGVKIEAGQRGVTKVEQDGSPGGFTYVTIGSGLYIFTSKPRA